MIDKHQQHLHAFHGSYPRGLALGCFFRDIVSPLCNTSYNGGLIHAALPSISPQCHVPRVPSPVKKNKNQNKIYWQYLREDLAKYGLAVAGVTPPSTAGAAAAAAATPANRNASSTSIAQRTTSTSSFKVPVVGGKFSTTSVDSSAATTVSTPSEISPGPRTAYAPSVSPPPPPAPAASASASAASPAASRPAPGKLSASRFDSFGRGGGAPAAVGGTGESSGLSAVASTSGSPNSRRRWTVGPSSSPTLGQSTEEPSGEAEVESESGSGSGPVAGGGSRKDDQGQLQAAAAAVVDTTSVGGLAERFGGVKLRSNGGGTAKFGGAEAAVGVDSSSSSGNGSAGGRKPFSAREGGSGRIAELARRFEKDTSGN